MVSVRTTAGFPNKVLTLRGITVLLSNTDLPMMASISSNLYKKINPFDYFLSNRVQRRVQVFIFRDHRDQRVESSHKSVKISSEHPPPILLREFRVRIRGPDLRRSAVFAPSRTCALLFLDTARRSQRCSSSAEAVTKPLRTRPRIRLSG